MKPTFSDDDVVNAVRWRLGIPVDNTERHQKVWGEWIALANTAPVKQQVERLGKFLSDLLEQAVRQKLGLSVAPGDEPAGLEQLWELIRGWLLADSMKRSPRISGLLKEAVTGRKLPPAATAPRAPLNPNWRPNPGRPATPTPGATPTPTPTPTPPAARPPARPTVRDDLPLERISGSRDTDYTPSVTIQPDSPLPLDAPSLPVLSTPMPESALPEAQPVRPNPRPVSGSQWAYRPAPADEPDAHPEDAAELLPTPDGDVLVAARVRGKKHKHEGTHCDDWFRVSAAGPWTILAVADGAGSRRLSRVGARASCETAVESLTRELGNARLFGHVPCLERDADGTFFVDADLRYVQEQVSQAVIRAAAAVEEQARARRGKPAYDRLVGRPVTADDLSATLLIAVHTVLRVGPAEQSLVVACQVGDGAVAVICPDGEVLSLGEPDSGAYSGETDFLTSPRQRETPGLPRRIRAFLGSLRALIVTTDGVSDDYHPAEPQLARLYADLVLNGILTAEPTGPPVLLPFDPGDGRLDTEVEFGTPLGRQVVSLRSAEVSLSELGFDPVKLAGSPEHLLALAVDTPLTRQGPAYPAERLRTWLDAYQIRGSFDDRTLVALHRPRAR